MQTKTWRRTLLLALGVAAVAVARAEVTVTEEPSSNGTETRTATNVSTTSTNSEEAGSKTISLPTISLGGSSSTDKNDVTKNSLFPGGTPGLFNNPELNAGIGGAILGAGGAVLVGTLLNKAGQNQIPCRRRRRRDSSDTEDVAADGTADPDAKARFIDPFNLFGGNSNYDCYQPAYGNSYQPSTSYGTGSGYQQPAYQSSYNSYDTSRVSGGYAPTNVKYQAPTASYQQPSYGTYQPPKQVYQAAPQYRPQQSYGNYQATQQQSYQPAQTNYQFPAQQQPAYQAAPQYKQYASGAPSYSAESYNAESYNREQYNNPTPAYTTPQPSYYKQQDSSSNVNEDFGYHPSHEYDSNYLYRSALPVEPEPAKDNAKSTAASAAYADKAAAASSADQKKSTGTVRFGAR